ncbi:Uncharacterised protein [Vibrio cholerae]|nr:Uncharacterised protein [Vibrio cholerae]CSI29738.1 Uncharacterised protein [Vibrio cholerae]
MLVHFDGINQQVFIWVVVLFNRLIESVTNVVHALMQDLREAYKHRQI